MQSFYNWMLGILHWMDGIIQAVQSIYALMTETWYGRIITAFFILVLFFLVRFLFHYLIGRPLVRWKEKNGDLALASIIQAFRLPFKWFWTILALYTAFLALGPPAPVTIFLSRFYRSVIIILMTWGFYNMTGRSAEWLRRLGERQGLAFRETLTPLISRILRFVLIVIAGTVLLQEFGYRIESVITGLGLGGLAISLAAQDTLKNMFGGAVILLEKTFTIGDWIETPDVSGTVEMITIRSTQIRTFDQGLVIVPNANLTSGAIKNWSRMGKRRIMFNLPLALGATSEQVRSFVNTLRSHLKSHPGVHPDAIYVAMNQFGDGNMQVLVYFFTKTVQYDEWLLLGEEINLYILDLLKIHGLSLAVPVRQIWLGGDALREVKG
ncbi:MAG: mechanosensitive ion channel family protein [Candidatus Carbobacillus altaicus]|nr:mechanosensitive ion channel family protein [Candidatus Carbobacillus altaicus]